MAKRYNNRFQKFYALNKDKINRKRRAAYKKRQKAGQCTRCHRKAVKGLTLCRYHRQKQKEYNSRR